MDLSPEYRFRNNVYYHLIKPLLPRRLQIFFRRKLIAHQLERNRHIWPIDDNAGFHPLGWQGWPEKKKFALVLTHDVDIQKGHDRCLELMQLEQKLGFISSFNFVPLRYSVSCDVRRKLYENGYEVGVHGLYHDGKYYQSKNFFLARAARINQYLSEWHAVGYRAPAMSYKLEWFHELNIEYDASTFDTDPFEPHAVGVGTIFPFIVFEQDTDRSYVELPYTMPQDFTLFVLMQQTNIDIWKKKLDWIVEHGGMVLLNSHPDYMNYGNGKLLEEEYPVSYYQELLMYIKEKYSGQYWHALPKEVARFWREARYQISEW